MKKYRVLGIMSGTSLDGLDIAYCELSKNSHNWHYQIINAVTLPYTDSWKSKLYNVFQLTGYELVKLNAEYGKYIGEQAREFLKKRKLKVDFISSHGHTVFHKPDENITYQIGSGAAIAAETEITTICDFRVLDVALNGQGAPLVPIGDMLLFQDYDCCLNLGGFANISHDYHNRRIAFDICPVNIVLNYYSRQKGEEFDRDGTIGQTGLINSLLLEKLNSLPYYSSKQPKSLGREWVETDFIPLINTFDISIEDKMRTIYEHVSIQVSKSINGKTGKKILVTGGGAHNSFLIGLFREQCKHQFVIPDKNIVDFKEALIFAFLGVLRFRGQQNCLSSVTGATHDNLGGVIYQI